MLDVTEHAAVFKGKRAQVLRALLHSRDEWFGLGAMAELAQVSTTTASETLTELERIEWVTARGQGPAKERKLENPKAILDEWAVQTARQAPYRRYHVSGANSDKLADRIAEVCAHHHTPYAITQESAAQRYAPFLTTIARVACRLPPGRAAEAVVGDLGARVVAEGVNLIIIERPTQGEFLFRERVGDVWLASPVQVYLDLQEAGGCAKEIASAGSRPLRPSARQMTGGPKPDQHHRSDGPASCGSPPAKQTSWSGVRCSSIANIWTFTLRRCSVLKSLTS